MCACVKIPTKPASQENKRQEERREQGTLYIARYKQSANKRKKNDKRGSEAALEFAFWLSPGCSPLRRCSHTTFHASSIVRLPQGRDKTIAHLARRLSSVVAGAFSLKARPANAERISKRQGRRSFTRRCFIPILSVSFGASLASCQITLSFLLSNLWLESICMSQ